MANLAAEGFIQGEEDAAHSAGADLAHDLVSRQALRERGGGIDDAVDLRQRADFPRQFRNGRAGRPAHPENPPGIRPGAARDRPPSGLPSLAQSAETLHRAVHQQGHGFADLPQALGHFSGSETLDLGHEDRLP